MATPQAETEKEPGSFAINCHNTALCLVPPESSWVAVDNLRALYDKAYGRWPPHVNLLYPFVQADRLEAAARRLQTALQQRTTADESSGGSLDVQLDAAGVFHHRREKTLFLHDSRENGCAETLQQLRATLVAALGGSSVNDDSDTAYHMHMTVAQSSSSSSGKDSHDGGDETPRDTLGHAHRFLRHKVELLPAVAWRADRLHILVRERIEQCGAVTSQMRLWGVVHLDDGRLERLGQPEPFYAQLPGIGAGVAETSGDAEYDDEDDDDGKDDRDDDSRLLPSTPSVTFVPEDRTWMSCLPEDWALFEPVGDAHPASDGAETLTVATYNVLGEFSWPPSMARVPLLVHSVLAAGAAADVLVLTEVTDHVLSALLADDGVRTAYPFASHGPPDQDDMPPLPSLLNVVVLSRRPFVWSWLAFARAHKGALVARWTAGSDSDDIENDIKNPRLVVAAVHLTHGLTTGAVACKRAETQRLLRYLRRRYYNPTSAAAAAAAGDATVVVAGDLNVHTSSRAIEAAAERKALTPQAVQMVQRGFDALFAREGFVDAWSAVPRPKQTEVEVGVASEAAELFDGEQGATYDPLRNALAARIAGSSLNNRPQRFDRIFVRQLGSRGGDGDDEDGCRLQVVRTNLFGFPAAGSDTTAPESFASDHWGLSCVLQCVEVKVDDGEIENQDEAEHSRGENAEDSKGSAGDQQPPAISSEVASLVVPVVPVQMPAGPLADTAALEAALVSLGAIPSDDEASRRRGSLELLKQILLGESTASPSPSPSQSQASAASERLPRQLVVVPAGSYGLGVWTPTSDLDCLCIGAYSPATFFALAAQRLLRAAATVQIVRRVQAHTGTMLELSVCGLHVDLQYCQAPMVAETWPAVLVVPPDHALVATLSPQTLSKLKAVRDLYYLRKSFPQGPAAEHFAAAFRAIKTWARARGLYAARFGYLGGIQTAVLLSRVMKLMDAGGEEHPPSVPDILATFFRHYAAFDWATKMAFDPFFHCRKVPYARTAREPLVILGYHRPQLNTSMAASLPSVHALAAELQRADRVLSAGRQTTWEAFLSGSGDVDGSTPAAPCPAGLPLHLPPGAASFVCAYRTYIKIDLQYWGLSLRRGASFVGWLESRCVMLLVDLARRLPQLNARIWPGRFVDGAAAGIAEDAQNTEAETTQYQGCYLIGLDLMTADPSRDDRNLALGTLQSVLDTFEKQIRRPGGGGYDPQWMWLGVDIASRADLGDVSRLRLDDRPWGEHMPGDEMEEEDDDNDNDGEDDDEIEQGQAAVNLSSKSRKEKRGKKGKKGKDEDRKASAAAVRVGTGKKLRSAQDVIKRLRWDPHLDRADYIVGYEDRFVGARERPLSAWKSEQTDEEFIPQHRVLYFRRRSDGVVIWDRHARKDDVFGSGV